MQSNRVKSYALVGIQFACLLLIAMTGPILARNPLFLGMELAALALGLWAVLSVRIGNFNVVPDVRTDGQLVQHGPYRFIRHPMYATLILGSLALVLDAPTWWRWLVWGVLVVDLVVKLTYEERLLTAHFPAYAAYQQASKRLVPWVW
jgi:protein-S-isoprenylcysteine O-methyltransferase Ste14